MKKLSYWAAAHPIQSRWLIAGANTILFLLAMLCAGLLYLFDATVPAWILMALVQVFFLAFVFYPEKTARKGWFKYSYARQKAHDFSLIISTFLVLMFGVLASLNTNDLTINKTKAQAQLINYTQGLDLGASAKKNRKTGKWKQLKQVRQNFKQELKQLKKTFKEQEVSQRNWIKVLLILLTVALTLGLGLVVAALSCSASCNGMEGLGIMILIVGWGALIWLSILGIKKIVNKDWSKPRPVPNS